MCIFQELPGQKVAGIFIARFKFIRFTWNKWIKTMLFCYFYRNVVIIGGQCCRNKHEVNWIKNRIAHLECIKFESTRMLKRPFLMGDKHITLGKEQKSFVFVQSHTLSKVCSLFLWCWRSCENNSLVCVSLSIFRGEFPVKLSNCIYLRSHIFLKCVIRLRESMKFVLWTRWIFQLVALMVIFFQYCASHICTYSSSIICNKSKPPYLRFGRTTRNSWKATCNSDKKHLFLW